MRLPSTFASVLALCCLATPAAACIIGRQDLYYDVYPACRIPTAAPQEKVVVIEVTSPLNDLGRFTDVVPEASHSYSGIRLIEIDVEKSERPQYVVISYAGPIIWSFRGAVDSISRIIVLGSTGDEYVGVMGVAKEKISFIKPLSYVLSSWRARSLNHLWSAENSISILFNVFGEPCASQRRAPACRPKDYFFHVPKSESDPTAVGKAIIGADSNERVSNAGEFLPAPLVRQAGVLSPALFEEPVEVLVGRDIRNSEDRPLSMRLPNAREKDLVVHVDPSEVVAQRPVVNFKSP